MTRAEQQRKMGSLQVGLVLLVCMALGRVQAAPTITCAANVTIANSTGCFAVVQVEEPDITGALADDVTVSTNQTEFPIGTTAVEFTVTNANGTDSCTTFVIVEAYTADNYTACAFEGACSTEPPYDCICGPDTGGDFCCLINSGNDTCSGQGTCSEGGVCECLPGYGGDWCCPTGSTNSTVPCGGNGCCTATGACECNAGFSGPTCEGPAFLALDPLPTSITTPLYTVVGVVVGVVNIAGVVALGTVLSTAAATGTTAAGSAGAFGAIGGI